MRQKLWNLFENHNVEGSACGASSRHREPKVANLIDNRDPEVRLSQATAIDWRQVIIGINRLILLVDLYFRLQS